MNTQQNLSLLSLLISLITLIGVLAGGIFLNSKLDADDVDTTPSTEIVVNSKKQVEPVASEPAPKNEFGEIAVRNTTPTYGYQGIAEFKGYYTTTERPTTLMPEPTVTCAAFVVTDGPEEAMKYMDNRSQRISDRIIVLGRTDSLVESPWWGTPDIKKSTQSEQVNAVFRIGSLFESAAVGCFDPHVQFMGTVPSVE